jgi:hypothetical protein
MTGVDETSGKRSPYPRSRRVFGVVFVASTLILGCVVVSWVLVLSPKRDRSEAIPPSPTPASLQTAAASPPPGATPSTPAATAFTPAATTMPVTPPPSNNTLEFTAGGLALATSCLTSLTSLVGFVFTTVVGVRRERREVRSADLDRQIRELELERQRLELERKRLEQGRDDQTPPKRD